MYSSVLLLMEKKNQTMMPNEVIITLSTFHVFYKNTKYYTV